MHTGNENTQKKKKDLFENASNVRLWPQAAAAPTVTFHMTFSVSITGRTLPVVICSTTF